MDKSKLGMREDGNRARRPTPLRVLLAVLVLCGILGAAHAAGKRMSLTAKVSSVDLKAKVFVVKGRVDGKAATVTVEIPRPNFIYYRWGGTLDDLREGDKCSVFAAKVNADKSLVAKRIMVFKGKKTRGAEMVRERDGGMMDVRGKLVKEGEKWALMAKGQRFVLDIPSDATVPLHDDAQAKDLAPKQRVSFTGNLQNGRMTRLSQLYINAKSPTYDPNKRPAEAQGGRRVFAGQIRRVDTELQLFVGSGELDGETVPLTVRWQGGWHGVAALPTDEKPATGRIAVALGAEPASPVFVLPSTAASRAFAKASERYTEAVAGEIVAKGESLGILPDGADSPHVLSPSARILRCREATNEDLRVGRRFLAVGLIPHDGRWLMENPALVVVLEEEV